MWSNGDPTTMPWGQDRSGPHWQPLRAILRVSVGVPEVAREAAIAARRLNRGLGGVGHRGVSKETARPQGPVASKNPALVALWSAPLPRRWRLRSAISGARDTAYEGDGHDSVIQRDDGHGNVIHRGDGHGKWPSRRCYQPDLHRASRQYPERIHHRHPGQPEHQRQHAQLVHPLGRRH